ncbi:hypothetical protein [Paenibacillus sp. Soil750]|uniref:hypothetical protein n=1 Tax=Paenibacillus sp. Soil750 TaxID=1736398 RepID=UPI0007018A20|nr:hypothetical protein [Paenibacillus sp. Soil750]KRE70910.1 hypothetical protein ASL11_11500 [Paenibacillus sp. Soil750]
MHSIHFHIHMLDNKHKQPTAAMILKVSSPLNADLLTSNPSSQHPQLMSPINKYDAPELLDYPAAH